MASGLPVVSSDRASLPEIVGDTGLLFDPLSDSGIADALEKGLFDDNFRETAIKAGPVKAKEFSWETSASKTLELLKSMID